VIETFELKIGSNQASTCMHTWINVRTRLGSNLWVCEAPGDRGFELGRRRTARILPAPPSASL